MTTIWWRASMARFCNPTVMIMALMTALAGFATPASAKGDAAQWTSRQWVSDSGGHGQGNPIATTRIIEFMSYTCPHCAHFEAESGDARKAYLRNGKVSFEVRNFVRDPVDMTVALLARCGDKAAFFRNHKALLESQPVWLAKAGAADKDTVKSWYVGAINDRLKKIATDLDLYAQMKALGFDQGATNACLTDKASQDAIVAMTAYARDVVKIEGTPGFTLNGERLDKVHDWTALEARLKNG